MDMLTKESKREEYNGKKEFNKVGLTLFIREILMFVSSIVAIIIYIIWLIVKSGDFSETMLDSVLNNILVNPYISIIPVMIGFIPVALFIKNKMNINSILIENKQKDFAIFYTSFRCEFTLRSFFSWYGICIKYDWIYNEGFN